MQSPPPITGFFCSARLNHPHRPRFLFGWYEKFPNIVERKKGDLLNDLCGSLKKILFKDNYVVNEILFRSIAFTTTDVTVINITFSFIYVEKMLYFLAH